MYSFYGGRPGNSFVITKTYSNKEEMLSDFSKGDNCQVHYDEYVLINNSDRLNKQHGNIYRRAYGTDATTAAVFIGNIAGPPGAAPLIDFIDYNDEKINDDQKNKTGYFSLVPGRAEQDGTVYFNNEIKWKSITQKNENNDDSTTYVGVQIPYPVFDFDIEEVSPYDTRGNVLTTATKIEKIPISDNPLFYHKWKISIPRGIQGNSIKDVEIRKNVDGRWELWGTLVDYSNSSDGEGKPTKLGDLGFIREIENITKEDNRITIHLTDNSDFTVDITPVTEGIIQDVTYNKINGRLEVNDGQSHIATLHIPTKITIGQNGEIKTSWTDTADTSETGQLKMPKTFLMNGRNLEIEWTNQSQKTNVPIIDNYIINAKIDDDTNHLLIQYFDSKNNNQWVDLGSITKNTEYTQTQLGPINWIGTGILNHIDTNNNILTFDIPLNKSIPYNNIIVTEGFLFSENGMIDSFGLASNPTIQKTFCGLRFIYNNIQDNEIFINQQISGESENNEESIQLENKQYYIKLKISNLILQLKNEESSNIIDTTTEVNISENTTEEELEEDTGDA